MAQERVVRGRLVTPTTVELEEPLAGMSGPVEVTLQLPGGTMIGRPEDPENFWVERTVEELAAEQGVSLPQKIDVLIGAGADLWDDAEDFD